MLQQQQQLTALTMRLSGMGPLDGEAPEKEPAIKELPPPTPTWPKCAFCQQTHDPSVKCQKMKLALKLTGEHDKAQAKARREAEAEAAATEATRGTGRGTRLTHPGPLDTVV